MVIRVSEDKKSQDHPPSKVRKIYDCPVCKTTHVIELPSNLAENRKRYPFPYVFIHSSQDNQNDIVSMLYIDKNLQIRGSEAVKLEKSDFVSEDVTKQLVTKLTDIIMNLEDENFKLKNLVEKQDLEELVKQETKNLKKALLGPEPEKHEHESTPEKPKKISFEVKDTQNQPNMRQQEELEPIPVEPSNDNSERDSNAKETKDIQSEIRKRKEIITKKPKKLMEQPNTKTPESTGSGNISIFFTSTIGPEEKKNEMIIRQSITIKELKKTVGKLYGLHVENFHLSLNGLTLSETRKLVSYNVCHKDEILIIPSSTAGQF
jgi:hypothetical protein